MSFRRFLPVLVAILLPAAAVAGAQEAPEQASVDETIVLEGADSGGGFFGDGGILGLIIEAGPVSWLVLAILLGFSLVSWAIILSKHRQLGTAERHSAAFLDAFRAAGNFGELVQAARTHPMGPLARLFRAGYVEIYDQSSVGGAEPSRLRVANMEAVARSLLRASSKESNRLAERMTFLATTGGATPFIGLFGTVWGIMNAFQDIALTQAANISVVAPGVSEALIATAAGLAAAIPAVIAYNAYLARIRRIESDMDDFSLEYVTMLERRLAA